MIPLLWRRTAATRLAVALAALGLGGGAVLGTQLASSALQGQAQLAARQAAGQAQYDVLPFARTGFTVAQARAVARLPAVRTEGLLLRKADLARLPTGAFRQVVLVVVGGGGVALRPLPLISGKPPAGHEIAVSQSLSPGYSGATGELAAGGVTVGQRLQLTESKGEGTFQVSGVVADSSPGAPFTHDAVYLSQSTATALFSQGMQVADMALILRPGSTPSQLTGELARVLHTDFTISNPRSSPGQSPISELSPVLDAMSGLSVLLTVALISATLSALVLERRRDIGLVRLAGASRALVLRSFLRETLSLAVVGALLGVGLGYLLAAILVAVSAPSGSGAHLSFQWPWTVASFGMVVALTLAGAVGPAIEASSVAPLEAISPRRRRWRTGRGWLWAGLALVAALGASVSFSVGGGLGVALGAALTYAGVWALLAWQGPRLVTWVGSLVGGVLAAPVAAVASRARTRPGRTALALGSLFVTVATAAGMAGLSEAALNSGNLWVSHLFVGNFLVVSPVAQSPKIQQEMLSVLRSEPGHPAARDIAPVRFLPARVGHFAVTLAATSISAYANGGALQFTQGARPAALRQAAAGQGVLVPAQLASALHLRVGSRIRLVAAGGADSVRVAGVVAHTLPGPSGMETMVLSQAVAVRHFGSGAAGFDLLQMRVSGTRAARAVRLAAFRYGMESENVAAVSSGVAAAVQHDIAVLSAVALAGVVIAILAAVNTVILDTREATRELALLRVVGLGRSGLRRAVVGEAAAMALLATALGVGAGIGLVYPEVNAASTPALPLAFGVAIEAVLALVGGTLLAIVLAALLPARQLTRIDPVAALTLE